MAHTKERHSLNADLKAKLQKIHIMKWLLNIENQDVNLSEQELQERIDKIANKNFARLTMLNHYLKQMPDVVKNDINSLLSVKKNEREYNRRYNAFKNNFETNLEYKELEQYIMVNITQDAICKLNNKQLEDIEFLKKLVLQNKQNFSILLFNLLYDDSNNMLSYDCSSLIYNLPTLVHWINTNKHKPIKSITSDDCEIIAGLFYGLDYDGLLGLNLSSFTKNYCELNKIITNLPQKFYVKNITQVLFRLLILKPLIWSYPSHEEVVKAIKGATDVL